MLLMDKEDFFKTYPELDIKPYNEFPAIDTELSHRGEERVSCDRDICLSNEYSDIDSKNCIVTQKNKELGYE